MKKFYSTLTKSVYDTEEELIKAEQSIEKENIKKEQLKKERAERARRVDEAFKQAAKAYDNANDLLRAFTEDYGSYHFTMSSDNIPHSDFLADLLMRMF